MPAAAMALAVIISCYYFIVIVAQPIHGQWEGHGCRDVQRRMETGQHRGRELGLFWDLAAFHSSWVTCVTLST